MTSFSYTVLAICIGFLGVLILYTLFLFRSGRLNAHITVRWLIAELFAIVLIIIWGSLPLIKYTSALTDREMMVLLAVTFFGFISFLILDCLARISANTRNINVIVQRIAVISEAIDRLEQK